MEFTMNEYLVLMFMIERHESWSIAIEAPCQDIEHAEQLGHVMPNTEHLSTRVAARYYQ